MESAGIKVTSQLYSIKSVCVLFQESAFCYDESAKEPAEIHNDCMFREGLTINVSCHDTL